MEYTDWFWTSSAEEPVGIQWRQVVGSHLSGVILGDGIWVHSCSVMAGTCWLGHKLKLENEILHVKMLSEEILLGKGARKRKVEGR